MNGLAPFWDAGIENVPQPTHVDVASSILRGSEYDVLLIHGFTGAPPEVYPLAKALHRAGHTVSIPLLAGHGETVDSLLNTDWTDWLDSAERSLRELRHESKLFVCGLSMGALLAINLASRCEVDGVVLMATPMFDRTRLEWDRLTMAFYRVFGKSWPNSTPFIANKAAAGDMWHYDDFPSGAIYELLSAMRSARKALPKVKAPALIFHGQRDDRVPVSQSEFVARRIGSSEKKLVLLENSGHIISADLDCERVAHVTDTFFRECSR